MKQRRPVPKQSVVPSDQPAASNTEPMLRGSIRADFVGGVCCVLLCCKLLAGLVVNAAAIIPQADKTRRILLAVGLGIGNRLLDVNFRLGWCINGAHLTFYAVASSSNFDVDFALKGNTPACFEQAMNRGCLRTQRWILNGRRGILAAIPERLASRPHGCTPSRC
jgi:hypothetical protein